MPDYKPKQQRIQSQYIQDLFYKIMTTAGVRSDIAEQTCEGLVWTSLRGVDSHGIRLLSHYMDGVEGGRINPDPIMKFEHVAPSVGTLDADHTFGHSAGVEAMSHAIALAEKAGIGAVGVKNSSHCGAMSFFGHKAAKRDMIGLAFTHATPRVKSPGSTRSFFGNNPVCLVAPMAKEEPFCFDAATTSITFNAVKAAAAAGETVPAGSVADKNGCMTTDPTKAEQLMPIGDYKGFGLSMMVDILCALLTGMPGGNKVSKMFGESMAMKRRLGQFYCAINISAFQDPNLFKDRLSKMAQAVRKEPSLELSQPVMVPGDPEKKAWEKRSKFGIPVPDHILSDIRKLEERYLR